MAFRSCSCVCNGVRLLFVVAVALLSPSIGMAKRVDWADPALQQPTVDPGADAEVVQWEVRVVDGVIAQGFSRDIEEYRAIKIFTDRGAQDQSQANLPYPDGMTIDNLEVRCTGPDGKSRLVRPDKMFDRTLLRLGRWTLKSRSFALPGVHAGTLVEYWIHTSSINPRSIEDLWLPCQLDVPVRSMQMRMRPWVERSFLLRWNQTVARIEPTMRDADGYLRMGAQGIPAYRSEPNMPEEVESRFTVLGHYGDAPGEDPQTRRHRLTAEMATSFRTFWQSRDSVPTTAARAVGDASSPQVKAARLFEYCRRTLKNTSAAAETTSASGALHVGIDQSVQFVLDARAGDALGINMVLGALARAAGLNAYPALLLAPEAAAFDTSLITADFAKMIVAIRTEDGLRYYDPGSIFTPLGMLWWEDERRLALVAEPGATQLSRLPSSPPDSSLECRAADLELDADGSLTGTVRVSLTGHKAMVWRFDEWKHSASERERGVTDGLRKRFPTAEVEDFAFLSADDAAAPCAWRYSVRIPDYAQRVGQRLFMVPAFFQRGEGAAFSDERRTHPVSLPFAYAAVDTVRIRVPEGYRVGLADTTVAYDILNVGRLHSVARVLSDGRTLEYARRLEVGHAGVLVVPVERYPELKAALDRALAISTQNVVVEPMPPNPPAAR